MPVRRRHRLAPLLVVVTALAAGLVTPGVAHAGPVPGAPVTADDVIRLDGRGFAFSDVLANDSDPDGDELEICRIEMPRGTPLLAQDVTADEGVIVIGVGHGRAGESSSEVLALASRRNRTGTYQITYYACDRESLTPATVTVEVTRLPEVRATKVSGRPGKVRFTNPSDRRVLVSYADRRSERSRRIGLAPHTSRIVTVTSRTIVYAAYVRRTGALAGRGVVRDIRLPQDR